MLKSIILLAAITQLIFARITAKGSISNPVIDFITIFCFSSGVHCDSIDCSNLRVETTIEPEPQHISTKIGISPLGSIDMVFRTTMLDNHDGVSS